LSKNLTMQGHEFVLLSNSRFFDALQVLQLLGVDAEQVSQD